MSAEADWYDELEELMRDLPSSSWEEVMTEVVNHYPKSLINRSKVEVKDILRGLIQKLSGFPPPWLVIAGPDGEIDTPDDIWIEPAYNKLEVERAWDTHDGRNMGTMVVGVYRWDPRSMGWRRDTSYGIVGNPGNTGKADPDDPDDSLCS